MRRRADENEERPVVISVLVRIVAAALLLPTILAGCAQEEQTAAPTELPRNVRVLQLERTALNEYFEISGPVQPVRGTDVTADGHRSTVSLATAAAWLFWEIRPRGRWRPAVGLGGGVLLPWAMGHADPRYEAVRDWSAYGYVTVGAQLAVVLTERLWLRLGLQCGLAVPRIEIVYGSETAATFGWPAVTGQLGLELRLD